MVGVREARERGGEGEVQPAPKTKGASNSGHMELLSTQEKPRRWQWGQRQGLSPALTWDGITYGALCIGYRVFNERSPVTEDTGLGSDRTHDSEYWATKTNIFPFHVSVTP